MSLQPFLDAIFKTPEAIGTVALIRRYGSKCSSFIEFGTRGGASTIIAFQALLDAPTSAWAPRFVGVDLVSDESIKNLQLLASKSNISFQFWQGHTKNYPVHQADAFLWDTFHCGGNLLFDLGRIAPHIQKYMFILGTNMDGPQSEAVRRGLDIVQVAKELHIDEAGVRQGLKAAITEFVSKNPDWNVVSEYAEITILERRTKA